MSSEQSSGRVMVTIQLVDGAAPTLDEVVDRYGLDPDDIDAEFGVVEIDPDARLYTILVNPDVAARIQPGDGWETEGPYSNPRIEPFGPPEA